MELEECGQWLVHLLNLGREQERKDRRSVSEAIEMDEREFVGSAQQEERVCVV